MAPMLDLDAWIDSQPAGSADNPCLDVPPPRAGTVVGGTYRIVGQVGAGAMGVVLLAHDDTLDRPVAIKWTRADLLTGEFRESFVSEARAMARVNHPNVVQIHAYGDHEGTPYFVMEYVDGPTLEQWLARGPHPPDVDTALRILDAVCDGVSAIHAAGTVHRDIKPSNILLDERLRPRVADLGLAVLLRQDAPLAGTPAYMAPEVGFLKGVEPVQRVRADVYSVACVGYELLTGRPPFDGTGNAGLLLQHAMMPVEPPSSVLHGLPCELDEPILRALRKDPAERTPSVEALRREIAAVRRGEREPDRILVAEDDDDFRGALQVFLGLHFPNAEVECVKNGAEAVEAVGRKVPSVAIFDLRMPGMNGIELTALLRARPHSATMPIIVVTASGGSDEWKRLAELGADRLLLKPVVMDDLVVLVRRVLGERSRFPLRTVA
jgi:serine/threonine-protein kinase